MLLVCVWVCVTVFSLVGSESVVDDSVCLCSAENQKTHFLVEEWSKGEREGVEGAVPLFRRAIDRSQ